MESGWKKGAVRISGYQVAHRDNALFAGDQPQVCFDGKWVTFMYSYPNWIPFDAATVHRITAALAIAEQH